MGLTGTHLECPLSELASSRERRQSGLGIIYVSIKVLKVEEITVYLNFSFINFNNF